MEKPFDAREVQANAHSLRIAMVGRQYVHYKGGRYVVIHVAVDEATGGMLVIYKSMDKEYVWSRTLENFNELVDGRLRFEAVSP